MYCPKCGTEVSDDKAFCPECGNPLKSQAQQSWQSAGSQNGTRPHSPVQFQSDTVVLPANFDVGIFWL